MVIRIRIFGALAKQLDARDIQVDVAEPVSVRAVNQALAAKYPSQSAFFSGARLAVNHAFGRADTPIGCTDEVALIELVGGG